MTEEKQDGGTSGSKLRAHVGELMLGLMVVAVVVMMIVPLTQWLLDLLIGVNICLSLMVVTLALFLRRPLTFNAFPTVLLVATLYRLSLNVASTRLILTQADAGRIIGAFGGYVVGGDILVGAVIFGGAMAGLAGAAAGGAIWYKGELRENLPGSVEQVYKAADQTMKIIT